MTATIYPEISLKRWEYLFSLLLSNYDLVHTHELWHSRFCVSVMTKKRRRSTKSIWLDALHRIRSVKRLCRFVIQEKRHEIQAHVPPELDPVPPIAELLSSCQGSPKSKHSEECAEQGILSDHGKMSARTDSESHHRSEVISNTELPSKEIQCSGQQQSSNPSPVRSYHGMPSKHLGDLPSMRQQITTPNDHCCHEDKQNDSIDDTGGRTHSIDDVQQRDPDLDPTRLEELFPQNNASDIFYKHGSGSEYESESDPEFQPFNEDDDASLEQGEGEHSSLHDMNFSGLPQNLAVSVPVNIFTGEFGGSTEENVDSTLRINSALTNDACSDETQSEGDDTSRVRDRDSSLNQLLQIWKSQLNLTALVAVVGSVRYTVRQYEFTRNMLRDDGASSTWPSYATKRSYFQKIIDVCMPTSEVVKLHKTARSNSSARRGDESTAERQANPDLESNGGNRTTTPSETRYEETEKVRIFFPSAWAKLDVATPVVFNQMFPGFRDGTSCSSPLDRSRIVQDRDAITGACSYIFVNDNGYQIPCRTGVRLQISVQNEQPSFATDFHIEALTEGYILHARIDVTWIVGSDGSRSPSTERALCNQTLTPQKSAVVLNLATSSRPDTQEDENAAVIVLGDMCTLLSSEHAAERIFPVLFHRYWKHCEGTTSSKIVWLRFYPSNPEQNAVDERSHECLTADVVENVNVANPAAVSSSMTRVLLYFDDFQKFSATHPSGSAGGCYFLPMCLPPEERRNTSSVRLISLTPPGVSTNHLLHYIVDDIVNTSVRGVKGYTSTGEAVKIFIDLVGFVGDYPASASVVDVVGHVGRSTCTVCSFKRLQDAGSDGSRFEYTTKVHANNSSFMRHGERHYSLRRSDISDQEAIILGMVSNDRYSDAKCPLLYLQKVMNRRMSRSALTCNGVSVVSNSFDAFRCNFIAPDHLLTDLSKDLLNTMFQSLPSKDLRLKADTYICSALRGNGLLRQNQVYNNKRKTLHSMTLSELFCVLLVSIPALRIILHEVPSNHPSRDFYRLLVKLQRLVALTYWCPLQELDGEQAVNLVHRDKEEYFSDLKSMSKQYVEEVDKLCSSSEIAKQHLDKPNLHRLIELYEHTIPAFGHVREIMELVFESAHQPLKRCIAKSNNHDSHVFAGEHCVGNDWQGRIAAMASFTSHPDNETRKSARRGLRRLLLGEHADLLKDDRDSEMIKELDSVLEKLFTPALKKQFLTDDMISNFAVAKLSIWKARGKRNVNSLSGAMNLTEADAHEIVNTSTCWIQALYPTIPDLEFDSMENIEPIHLFARARRVKISQTGRQIGKPSGPDSIFAGCCV